MNDLLRRVLPLELEHGPTHSESILYSSFGYFGGSLQRNDRSIATFAGLGHGTLHGFELAIPLFVPLWLVEFDVSPTLLGLAIGAGYALIGLVAPLAGVLADRYGSKRIVLVSIGGMGLSFAALFLADSVLMLAMILVLWGMAAGLYHPAGLSLISRRAERRGTVLAYHGAAGNVGMVVLPLAAIVLLLVFDWRLVAVLLALPAALCVCAGLLLQFEGQTAHRTGRQDVDALASVRNFFATTRGLFVGGFLFLFAIQMAYGMYYRGVFTFLPEVLGGLPIFEPVVVGAHELEAGQLVYSGLLLVGVFGQYAGGILSDRADPERALVANFLVLTIASVLFVPAAAVGTVPLLAICAVLGFCIYAFAPIGQSLIAEYVSDRRHGLSFGYVYLGTFGVGALGAAIAGATLDLGGTITLFTVLATLVAVCTVLAIWLRIRVQTRIRAR